jgi:hypothetical protein
MTAREQLRQAVAGGDYGRAEALLGKLPRAPQSLEETGEIKQLLTWALQVVRANRAHDAARLAAQARASAYRPRGPETRSTWALDG